MVRLFKVHANGKLGIYEVYADGGTIRMMSQTRYPHGARTNASEVINQGRAGRSVAEQVQLRIEARIRNKLDGGYKLTEAEALDATAPTNTLGMHIPMTAKSNVKYLDKSKLIYFQPKLDGMRLIITKQNNTVFAYTRKGKLLDTVSHLFLDAYNVLEEGEFLDGELYAHGTSLQTIMSWAKRGQDHTRDLKFHCFDMISDEPFWKRSETIKERITRASIGNIVPVTTGELKDGMDLTKLLDSARQGGYEGLMLRDGNAPYQVGKRSRHLIKVKKFLDSEYLIRDVTVGALGMTVLVCETRTGDTFRVTAPGTHANKQYISDNPETVIGNYATVKYSGLTKDDIPFHPVCIDIRDEIYG